MKIELKQQYKSITSLETVDLPDFAILIGRNGAGKTQLLNALMEGSATIRGINVNEIELHDMNSFRAPNASEANRNANQFAQITADIFLESTSGGQPLVEIAKTIFDQFASQIESDSGAQARDEFERRLRDKIRRLPDFDVFMHRNPENEYEIALYQQVMTPLKNRGQRGQSSNRSSNSFNGDREALLSTAMKLMGKLPHELTRGDITGASYYEGETLSNSLSQVFATYKVDQFVSAHKRIETDHIKFTELISDYRSLYPPPWETLREILSAMRHEAGDEGLFDFGFSDPEDYELNIDNYAQFTFKAEMTNRSSGAEYELDSLSSGEKILMALCLASFNQNRGRRAPKLLLLDELDAVLHPSMIAAMVRTLRTVFEPQGTKILMTSHSAMTVATLDEPDIFRVVRTCGHVKVSRTTKSEAIDELSEGLATVDMGLRIASSDEAKVTILTEGNNAKHLKRWVDLNFPEDVHVFEGLEHQTNDQQLLEYGRLLGKMITNTHFVVVWDCDAGRKAKTLEGELSGGGSITPFAFAKRKDNTIADSGIENNYDEETLKPFCNTTIDNDGSVVARSLPSNRKTEFANDVLQNGTSEYFTNFQDLYDIISGILGSTPPKTSPQYAEATVDPPSNQEPYFETLAGPTRLISRK